MPRSLPERLLRRAVIGAYDVASRIADLRNHGLAAGLSPLRRILADAGRL
jgi:hypothetical protein